MKQLKLLFLSVAIILTIAMPTEAATAKVIWGKDEIKPGQIGKVTILENTILYKVDNKVKPGEITPSVPLHFEQIRILKLGEVYRVYNTKTVEGYAPLYGVGGGLYVLQAGKNDSHLKYETPSKAKLLLVNKK